MTIQTNVEAFSRSRNPQPPRRLGRRYSAQAFLPEAGNTVVCHLDRTDPAHQHVLEARRAVQALPGAENLLFTPPESLHMTLFEGVIETRRTADAWPAGVDRDASVVSVTEQLQPRLSAFAAPPSFSVQITGIGPGGLTLAGATERDAVQMRAWRDALTLPFGYRHRNHDAYTFHMTFAYPVGWIDDALVSVWTQRLHDILTNLVADVPVLPLCAPALCRFADMTRFEELVVLSPRPEPRS